MLRCTAIWSAVSGAAFGERPVESVASKGASWREAFPDSDPLAVKLASDSVRFLARATNLDPAFLEMFDRTTGSDTDASRTDGEVPAGEPEQLELDLARDP